MSIRYKNIMVHGFLKLYVEHLCMIGDFIWHTYTGDKSIEDVAIESALRQWRVRFIIIIDSNTF